MAHCHNCGRANPPATIFCTSCAAELRATQAKLTKARQIFLPPQDDFVVSPRTVQHPPQGRSGLWLLALLALLGIIIWVYGRY